MDMREVVNAIFYVLRGDIPWRMLPHDLPPWKTVYDYFRLWRSDGRWERAKRQLAPAAAGKDGPRSHP